jgi:hypothetical protein
MTIYIDGVDVGSIQDIPHLQRHSPLDREFYTAIGTI